MSHRLNLWINRARNEGGRVQSRELHACPVPLGSINTSPVKRAGDVASGQCNGAVSPLPCQSVDGFFDFHDLIRIIIIKNEWFDRR